MKKLLLALLLAACPASVWAQNPPIIQGGAVTPGHVGTWITNGVLGDGGAPGGPIFTGSTILNDFACVGATGTIIDCGLSATGTNAWTGLQNFNGGATAPTRAPGDNTTNVATTAFVAASTASGGAACNVRPANETAYTVGTVITDNGGCVQITNTTAAVTVTLPATFPYRVTIVNNTVGAITTGYITAMPVIIQAGAGGNILGEQTVTLAPLQSAQFFASTSNWNVSLSFPNTQFGNSFVANSAISYSLGMSPGGMAISGTCTAGDVVGFNFASNNFATIQFRHTMTAAASCLKDAVQDIAAQYKANAAIKTAIGADAVDYSITTQSGNTWNFDFGLTWPFALPGNGNPVVTPFTSGGATEVVTAAAGNTNLEAGAGFTCVRSTAWAGRVMQAGDPICGFFFAADTSTYAADARNVSPFYGSIVAVILDPAANKTSAELSFGFDMFSFNKLNASTVLVGIGTSSPTTPLDINLNGNTGLNPAVGGGATPLFVVNPDSAATIAEFRSYRGGATQAQPVLAGVSAGGTGAAPSVSTIADWLFYLAGKGWDATNGFSGAATSIEMRPAGTWSATDHRSFISFSTTPNNSLTLTEAARLNPDGSLTVGYANTIGAGNLGVKSTLEAGINGTAGGQLILLGSTSGNLTQAVLATAGTPTITWGTGSGTPTVTVTSDTNVTLAINTITGNLVAGWTGTLGLGRGGINANLSATGGTSQVLKQVSVGANITVGQLACGDLSDCTSGTWTPTIVSSGGGTPTYTTNVGFYRRTGNQVVTYFSVILSGIGTLAAGNITIAGLPFTQNNTSNFNGGCSFNSYAVNALAAGSAGLVGFILPNTTVITPQQAGNAATANLTQAQMGGTATLFGWCALAI